MLEVVYEELLNGYLGGGGGELDNFLMQVSSARGFNPYSSVNQFPQKP